ncbi:MAG: DUF5666 domain-containing protein [Chloroflexi bacterium]|nr:DUF5666 domain-containing protein [Chloroflexota bacterium]
MAGLVALSFVLATLSGSSASANSTTGKIEAVFGTAVEIRLPDAIVVATSAGLVTLRFNDESELKIVSAEASLSDVAEGDRVISTASRNTDGELVALKTVIQIANSQPVTKHVVGVVTRATAESLSIQTRNGDVVEVIIGAGFDVPQVGEGITLVAQLNRSSGVLTAGGFELTSRTVERLEYARDRAADQAEKERLAQIAIDARSKHLSALDNAARALQRVTGASTVDREKLDQATVQLIEIQRKFRELQIIYEDAARDRNEEIPLLSISGALVQDIGKNSFTIVPRGEQDVDPFSVVFSFDSARAMVNLPSDLLELVAPGAKNPQLLSDVQHLIDPASELDVKYTVAPTDPNSRSAVSIRVNLPRLVAELEAVLSHEAHRAFHGVITFVEIDGSLEAALGIVVAANDQQGIKVAAKVTSETEITLDGQPAEIGALAAGQPVDIQFETADVGSLSEITGAGTTLRAIAIRARSSAPTDEQHISGIVKSVNAENSTIEIRPTDGSIIRLSVSDKVTIFRNGRLAHLADVEDGDLVVDATRTDPSSESLTKLIVVARTNVTFTGTITGVGLEPARLLVTGENGRSVNVLVTNDTWIVLDGRRVKFEEVRTGLRIINGVYAVAGRAGVFYNIATIVSVESPKIARSTGTISAVNAALGTLTILSGTSSNTKELELHLPERPLGENLLKDGQPVRSLLSIGRADHVDIVLYEVESGKIEKLSVVSDNFMRSRGTLIDISPGLRFATVELVNGRKFELWVGAQSVVRLNGRLIESLSPVADLLARTRTELFEPTALVPEVLFFRDSPSSSRGVIITIAIQIKTESDLQQQNNERGNTFVEVTVSGVIEAISGRTWAIDGRVFIVNDKTEFFGEKPEVGLVAKAALVTNFTGTFVAQAISVAGRPDVSPTQRLIDIRPDSSIQSGTTGQSDGQSHTFELRGEIKQISQRGIVIETILVAVSDDVIAEGGDLAVGAVVRAKVNRTAEGTVRAVSIEVLRPAGRLEVPASGTGSGTGIKPQLGVVPT